MMNSMIHRQLTTAGLMLLTGVALGCTGGNRTDTLDSIAQRDISGVAGPSDRAMLRPVERIPRGTFGTDNTADALTFGSANNQVRGLFDVTDGGGPLTFFTTDQTRRDGIGPVMNQLSCLGCHGNSEDLADQLTGMDLMAVTTVSTPASRAGRLGVTDHDAVTIDNPPPTGAFTIFGDFTITTAAFNGLVDFGGPVRHVLAVEGCNIDQILPEEMDPNLRGEDTVRVVAERAGPPYLGRGLMEAIYWEDIAALADPSDDLAPMSTLAPAPASSCVGDCISGRVNQGRASDAIMGGDPVVRLARFGLRAAGPTLIQFMVGGSQGELGMSSPLNPSEPSNPQNVGTQCDVAPDPELTMQQIRDLRDMIRFVGIPEFGGPLLSDNMMDPRVAEVREGARLFGVDYDAFRARMVDGMNPPVGDFDEEHGISTDRGLGCVSCHTPVVATGESPAAFGGDLLSNRWVPLFSDMLIHDMGQFPIGADVNEADIIATNQAFDGVSRNLADFAIPGQGLAEGFEWRTPPMMGIGRIGPPFMHDARVYINTDDPAFFYYGSRDADAMALPVASRRVEIVDLETAFQAAIELHDLPQPPDFDLNGVPDYDTCPTVPFDQDVCRRDSRFRSEARNVMEKWHALTDAEQRAVIRFMMTL